MTAGGDTVLSGRLSWGPECWWESQAQKRGAHVRSREARDSSQIEPHLQTVAGTGVAVARAQWGVDPPVRGVAPGDLHSFRAFAFLIFMHLSVVPSLQQG